MSIHYRQITSKHHTEDLLASQLTASERRAVTSPAYTRHSIQQIFLFRGMKRTLTEKYLIWF